MTIYLVVPTRFVFDDAGGFDPDGKGEPVAAYRSRERAEERATQLNDEREGRPGYGDDDYADYGVQEMEVSE